MLCEVGYSGEPVVVRKLGHKLKMTGEKVELRRQVGGCNFRGRCTEMYDVDESSCSRIP